MSFVNNCTIFLDQMLKKQYQNLPTRECFQHFLLEDRVQGLGKIRLSELLKPSIYIYIYIYIYKRSYYSGLKRLFLFYQLACSFNTKAVYNRRFMFMHDEGFREKHSILC